MSKLASIGFLTEDQRLKFNQFPESIEPDHLIQYFLLSNPDLKIIPVRSPAYSRLGFALSLCALRFLGFIPEELITVPITAMSFLLKQLNLASVPEDFAQYGSRLQTKSDHTLTIENYLGFKRFTEDYQRILTDWLLVLAMEHDGKMLLLKAATEKLQSDKIMRPTLNQLERIVGSSRDQARKKTYQLVSNLLSNERKTLLDNLLLIDQKKGNTIFTWLRQRAVAPSPESILTTLEKVAFLQQAGVTSWDLSMLNANRLKTLNRLGKCSTNQALQRSAPERRYPILIAFMHQALEELIDESVDLFDQCLSKAYSRSKSSLKKHHERVQETTNEKVRLLKTIGSVILNDYVSDTEVRKTLYNEISVAQLRAAINECDTLIRPKNDKYLDYFGNRFSYLRKFTPTFLEQLSFQSIQENNSVLQAVKVLIKMNKSAAKKIEDNAPIDFISDSWKQYVFRNDKIDRKYYELCTLWELRNILRSGDIWVAGGRRYNNPEHYLIPKAKWLAMKTEACEFLQIPQDAKQRLNTRKQELEQLFIKLNGQIAEDDNLKIVDNNLIVSPLEAANETTSLTKLRKLIGNYLPKIDLPDLLIEVDSWVNFSECFSHAGNQMLNPNEFPIYLYAAMLGEATNLGPMAISEITDLNYERIIWYKNWLIRNETLNAARTKLVNFQHNQELAQYFGDGTFSSSDGRRVPVGVKTTTARSFVKYFAFETGINLYSWTSDQYP